MLLRSRSQSVHWQAPAAILLAFTASLCLGIGHHLFYASLDQVPVEDNLFSQQINVAIGTGFAFLFRASLAIATCTAYWQIFWHTALRKTLTLSSVDALTGVLGSLLDFSNIRTFFFNPGLTALALLAWLVPLASLLPPATLSVLPATTTNYTSAHIAVPNFADVVMSESNQARMAGGVSMNSDGTISYGDTPDTIVDRYVGSSLQISRLVTTTAYRGAVPDYQTLYPNSTYELDFNGPAMQCRPIPQEILEPFNRAAGCNLLARNGSSEENCPSMVPYVSWVPDGNDLVPFGNGSLQHQLLPLEAELGQLQTSFGYNTRYLGQSPNGPASVFVATRSQVPPIDAGNWDVLNCSMYNATYVVNVSSDSNRQSLAHLAEVRIIGSAPFHSQASGRDSDKQGSAQDLAMFSYMGMMESLNKVLVGTIVTDGGFGPNEYYLSQQSLRVQSASLMSTLLAFSHELVPFMSRSRSKSDPAPLDDDQWTDVASLEYNIISMPNEALTSPSYNQSLGSAIEELFQNMTMSLFSDARFLKDSEEPINITRSYTRNTYSYSQRNLLMSYGIALFLTLLASIAGCIAIFWNGASYTHKFSTVLRTTTELGELVAKNDRTGADPLPKYLSRARVELGRNNHIAMAPLKRANSPGERSAMMGSDKNLPKEPGIISQRTLSSEM